MEWTLRASRSHKPMPACTLDSQATLTRSTVRNDSHVQSGLASRSLHLLACACSPQNQGPPQAACLCEVLVAPPPPGSALYPRSSDRLPTPQGLTSVKCWWPHHFPVRATPHCTCMTESQQQTEWGVRQGAVGGVCMQGGSARSSGMAAQSTESTPLCRLLASSKLSSMPRLSHSRSPKEQNNRQDQACRHAPRRK